MPSIADLIKPLQGYHPIDAPSHPPIEGVAPVISNMFLRSPIPQIGNASSDSLAQSERNGSVPQYRTFIIKS